MLWYIGNTSVRSAFRLRDGLVALSTSPLQGNIRGMQGDIDFRQLLGQNGIVSLGTDITNSAGRKWRSALEKLGFLYPMIDKSSLVKQEDIGLIDTITPNGWRLIRAEKVPAMQECFLRALAAQYFEVEEKPSIWFSPLRHTLAVLFEIERKTGEAFIDFLEMAIVVQLTSSADNINDISAQIINLRNARNTAESKRRFDNIQYEEKAKCLELAASTFSDCADMNFRYLKATGLVQSKGKGISLVQEKRLLAKMIAKDTSVPKTELDRYKTLCNGATLPTDTHGDALKVLNDSISQLLKMGISYSIEDRPVKTPADIAILRHEVDDLIAKQKEEVFSKSQATQWKEIIHYMEMIASRKDHMKISDEYEIKIPKNETPAYLEWSIWRAFLAINSLKNKSYEARRFKIDQDFLPVSTAPGNGPDLIFEFESFIIVTEVTLTESSRQEAAEGEPVRRHVADLMIHYAKESNKPVYGLFIANNIDSNTAETFRIGVWYTQDDKRLQLRIVPITLLQFCSFFRALFLCGKVDSQEIMRLMIACEQYRVSSEAPIWKELIAKTVNSFVSSMGK